MAYLDRAISHHDLANAVRMLAVDAVERAKSGHPGMPMGMADVATVLWSRFLKFDPECPDWPDRDRFVLSAGHGSMLLYALLHLTGFAAMTMEQIRNFRQLGSLTPGHPEYGHTPGVETTTGPLGQGFANAVGMALAEKLLAERFSRRLVDHRTYVIAGDGCLMEGISHEAASLAGHLGLGRLIVLYDDNAITIDGPTRLACSDDTLLRFTAYGWHIQAVNGHDPEAIARAIEAARLDPRPSLIACRTVIGFGAPNKQGQAAVHGAPLGPEEVAATRAELGWKAPPFTVPPEIRNVWRHIGLRGKPVRKAWERSLASTDPALREEFLRTLDGRLPDSFSHALRSFKAELHTRKPALATRKASEETLNAIAPALPELIGGSADLTHSNNTLAKCMRPIESGDFSGRYVHFGVREHAMAAIMNGLAVHRGFIPYGGTFLVFSDYCRPAIRLSALMGLRVIYVMTHDSIGLGEDGPTHQPIEHLASLRAMPNILVFRPADAVETAECWEIALQNKNRPSVLALSRQSLPFIRTEATEENLCARGAYVVAEAHKPRALTLLATGSEVHLALKAREELAKEGLPVAVVSMPCFELFEEQDPAYREATLGSAPRLAIEAATPFGWTRYVVSESHILSISTFGASAPAEDLYKHFGLTVEAILAKARMLLATAKAA
jgi:transketolase